MSVPQFPVFASEATSVRTSQVWSGGSNWCRSSGKSKGARSTRLRVPSWQAGENAVRKSRGLLPSRLSPCLVLCCEDLQNVTLPLSVHFGPGVTKIRRAPSSRSRRVEVESSACAHHCGQAAGLTKLHQQSDLNERLSSLFPTPHHSHRDLFKET